MPKGCSLCLNIMSDFIELKVWYILYPAVVAHTKHVIEMGIDCQIFLKKGNILITRKWVQIPAKLVHNLIQISEIGTTASMCVN